MFHRKILIYYVFSFFLFAFIIKTSFSRKWSVEDLAQTVKEWNYLNDPEELISDKKLGPKIHTSYLTINHVYEKTDINLFYITDVITKYEYKRHLFVEDLYEAMLNNTSINTKTMKKHHLFIVIFRKYDEVIFFGSSPELEKLLYPEKILNIEMEIKKAMKNEKNSAATIIFLIFDKLQKMWKKFSINIQGNTKRKKLSSGNIFENIKDIIYLGGSLSILSLFFYILCCRGKKKDKKD